MNNGKEVLESFKTIFGTKRKSLDEMLLDSQAIITMDTSNQEEEFLNLLFELAQFIDNEEYSVDKEKVDELDVFKYLLNDDIARNISEVIDLCPTCKVTDKDFCTYHCNENTKDERFQHIQLNIGKSWSGAINMIMIIFKYSHKDDLLVYSCKVNGFEGWKCAVKRSVKREWKDICSYEYDEAIRLLHKIYDSIKAI